MGNEAGHFLLNLRQLILCYALNIFLSSCSSPLLGKGEWEGKLFLFRNQLTFFKPVIFLSEPIAHFKEEVRYFTKKEIFTFVKS